MNQMMNNIDRLSMGPVSKQR